MSHRRVVNAVLWLCRTGSPWRDLPAKFRSRSSIATRFYRWQADGTWKSVFSKLRELTDAKGLIDWDMHCVDSTVIRVKLAVCWFGIAARDGYPVAQSQLARQYINADHSVPNRFATALKWAREASDTRDTLGDEELAYMYRNGLGVTSSKARAVAYRKKAIIDSKYERVLNQDVTDRYDWKSKVAGIEHDKETAAHDAYMAMMQHRLEHLFDTPICTYWFDQNYFTGVRIQHESCHMPDE